MPVVIDCAHFMMRNAGGIARVMLKMREDAGTGIEAIQSQFGNA